MTGMAALKAGAGLVTVASADSAIDTIAAHAPELMTVPLPETEAGSISEQSFDQGFLTSIAEKKTVVALGPGLGTHPDTVQFVRRAVEELRLPMVIDADGLNSLDVKAMGTHSPRVLTPHPGEMSRLIGRTIAEIQADRVGIARAFAMERGVCLVLKGHRTVVAFADGRAFVNPTSTPALATGGTGDVLTGLIAGLIAQFPDQLEKAVLASVYLHGRAGQLGAADIGERAFVATDILRYLPDAMREAGAGCNPNFV